MPRSQLPLAAFPFLTLLCLGCSLNTSMVPIQGPLSQQRPVPTIDVHVGGILGNHGDLSFTMPDGERCKGQWTSLSGGNTIATSGSLLATYDSAQFSALATKHPGQALATCDRSRTVQVEFASSGKHGVGVAKDNEGNVYRFVF